MGTCVLIILVSLQTTHCEEVMLHQMIRRWCCMFIERRQDVGNDLNGHLSTSVNGNNILKVKAIVLLRKRVMVSEWRPHYLLVGLKPILRPIVSWVAEE
ncbi:hypothetical protein TNCV_1253321 [Trichonephila clavipes]|nr:hypothetical protein TNCV_1253321 [Trichonephila clavipes]